MHGIEILFWALSALFWLALLFAILLWCRSWRKEERELTRRHIQMLSREVERLGEAIEMLDHTVASLQTADEQFGRRIEALQRAIPSRTQPDRSARDEVDVSGTRAQKTDRSEGSLLISGTGRSCLRPSLHHFSALWLASTTVGQSDGWAGPFCS